MRPLYRPGHNTNRPTGQEDESMGRDSEQNEGSYEEHCMGCGANIPRTPGGGYCDSKCEDAYEGDVNDEWY